MVLARRGADAIKEAVERNRERKQQISVTGVLNTVSDGADMLRLTLDDGGKQVRMNVEPDVGVQLGPLLGKRVSAEVALTVKWNLATGREKFTYTMISATEGEADGEPRD